MTRAPTLSYPPFRLGVDHIPTGASARLAGERLGALRSQWPLIGLLAVFGLTTTDTNGITGWTSALYTQRGSLRLSLADVVLVIGGTLIVAKAPKTRLRPSLASLDWCRSCLLWLTVVFALAVGQGAVLGVLGHGQGVLVAAKAPLYLVVMPWLVVKSVRQGADLVVIERCVLVFALAQSAIGVLNVSLGVGHPVGDTVLSAYAGGPLYMVLIGAFVAEVILCRGDRDWLALITLPSSLVMLVLSQRRSFELAAILVGVVLLMAVLSRRRGAVFLLTLLIAGGTVLADVSGHLPKVVNTGSTPSYNAVHSERGDQYRASERSNIVANLERSPLGGVGFGVPWTQYEPLPGYFKDNFQYSHVGVLWFWLKMGLVGALAYVALVGFALWAAVASTRRAPWRLRSLALATAGALAADFVLEATASFAGADPQYTLLLGLVIGLAVAEYRIVVGDLRPPPGPLDPA